MTHPFKESLAKLSHALLLIVMLALAACSSAEQRAQNYYERGMKLLSQKDYVKASIEFRNALQLKKDLVPAWRGLAQVEDRNQNLEALVPILRTIVELDPKDLDARVRLVRLMVLGNALDDALKLINAAADQDGRNAKVLGNRALILLRLNDGIGAVRDARDALELDPGNAEAIVVLAVDRLSRGDAEGALMILDRDAGAQVKDIGLQLFKINVLEQLGDHQRVEELFRKLIVLYPQEPGFRWQLVRHYLQQKRPDDAEHELRVIAAGNPTDVEAGLDVVRFLYAVKGPAAARTELLNRINAGGQVFRYQIALAQFDFEQGNIDDSMGLLEQLIARAESPEQKLTAQVRLVESQIAAKKIGAAEKLVSEILGKDSRNTDGLRLRAAIRLEQGQLEAAIADARQALNEQPRSAQIMLLLASA
jgi:cellulose synthase operon protein C